MRSELLCLVVATVAAASCGGGSTGGTAPEIPGLSGDGQGGKIFFEPRANAKIEVTGMNDQYVVTTNGVPASFVTDALLLHVTGAGCEVSDTHDNNDGKPRLTMRISGAHCVVRNENDALATMNVDDAETTLVAGGVSLFQGGGAVHLDGAGNTVVLARGAFDDSTASVANTWLVGNGSTRLRGAAEVAMVEGAGAVTVDDSAALAIVTGGPALKVVGAGAGTNLLATPLGGTAIVTGVPTIQAWDAFDPFPGAARPAGSTSNYFLTPMGPATYAFTDLAAGTNVHIGGTNDAFEIVADGQRWTFTANTVVVTVSGPRAVVVDDHDGQDQVARMTLNVGGTDATVTITKDNSASVSVTGGTTSTGAIGVGVLQGAGAVKVTGSLTAVLLGQGAVSDTSDAFANTYLVGIGGLDVFGSAVVAGVLKAGAIRLRDTAKQDIASAEEGVAVTVGGPAGNGNIRVSTAGVRGLADSGPGPLVSWDSYRPASAR